MNTNKVLTIDEACQKLRIGRTLLYALIKGNRLKTVHIGRRSLVTSASIAAFLDEIGAGS